MASSNSAPRSQSKPVSLSVFERALARRSKPTHSAFYALIAAARASDPSAFKKALLNGADLSSDDRRAPAVDEAARAPKGGPEMLSMLRSLGINLSQRIHTKDFGLAYPFEIAARAGSLDSCALLAQDYHKNAGGYGYILTARERGTAAAWVAAWAGRYRKNALALRSEASAGSSEANAKSAASAEDERYVKEILALLSPSIEDLRAAQAAWTGQKPDKNVSSAGFLPDEPPLKSATPSLAAMAALLAAGAPVDEADPIRGSTALHKACSLLDDQSVQLLLAHGADHSLENKRGLTPLRAALASACSIEPNGALGAPLTRAKRRALSEVALLLLEAGADPEGDCAVSDPATRELLALAPLVTLAPEPEPAKTASLNAPASAPEANAQAAPLERIKRRVGARAPEQTVALAPSPSTPSRPA